jgi:hypothetical protein
LIHLLRYCGVDPVQATYAGTSICAFERCERQCLVGYSCCANHVTYQLLDNHRGKVNSNIEQARELFNAATQKQWEYNPRYNIVRSRIKEISDSKRPGTDLIILDDEWSPASKQL